MKTSTLGAYTALLTAVMVLSGCGSRNTSNDSVSATSSPSVTNGNRQCLSFPDGAHGLRNCATIQHTNGKALLNLGDGEGYYAMGVDVGKFICKLNDFSFAVRYYVGPDNPIEGYGHFIFACSELAENGPEQGPYIAYRLNEQRFEISTGGYMHEEAIMVGKPTITDQWVTVVYRQRAHRGELFIDGELIGSNEFMPYPAEVFKSIPENIWIGRAPFQGDKYLTDTKIDFLNLYDYTLSDEEIDHLMKP